jgi:hypothetical protein
MMEEDGNYSGLSIYRIGMEQIPAGLNDYRSFPAQHVSHCQLDFEKPFGSDSISGL